MKFVQFIHKSRPDEVRVGFIEDNNVVDINKCDCLMPCTLIEILKKSECMCRLYSLQKTITSETPLSDVILVAPITGVDKILCLAMNYTGFCKEKNVALPKFPVYFSKFSSCIIGQNEAIKCRTAIAHQIDWEVELALVIGKKCTNVKADDAMAYIFGYTIAQDITSRDWQAQNGGQFLLGKAQDTFCPLGPCIASADEVGDPHALDIKCSVNGVEKQNSNTCNLVFKIPDVIERVSSVMTLLPGDIILTGTPAGIGFNRNPQEFLKPGDVLRSEIQNIGAFEVKVVAF